MYLNRITLRYGRQQPRCLNSHSQNKKFHPGIMSKYYLLFIFIIFLVLRIQAQNTVSGTVTDDNARPLPGTNLFIPDLNRGTFADEHGHFQLGGLPAGSFSIQFSFIGYENKIVRVSLEGKPVNLEIRMEPSAIHTREIVISGGYNATQHENAVKIDILNMDERSLKNSPNFTEKLTSIPGVDMISKGSGISRPVIRGLAMNDILVLNQGVRFENYQYSSHHPLGINEFGISDVEIIKGPASMLYGSDAIGGVINFIREKPAPSGTVSGDYNLQLHSNTLGMNNNLGIKGSGAYFSGGIRAGHETNADFLQGGGAFAANTRFNEKSLKANAGYTGKTGVFRLFYDYNHQNLGLAEEEAIGAISSRGRKNELFYQQLLTHMLSSQNKLFFGKIKLDLNAAWQYTDLTHFGEPSVREVQMNLSTLTYEARMSVSGKKSSEYILGFQGLNQANRNGSEGETILLPDAVTGNYSLFALMQHTVFKKVKLQSGFRVDRRMLDSESAGLPEETGYRMPVSRNFNSLSGSVGATYSLKGDWYLRANVASAFRTPNLAELTSNGPHETRYEVGDQQLVPEKSIEADLSMHLHRPNITLDVAGFFNRISDYIFISPTSDTSGSGLPVYRYKQNDSYLAGGEAGIHIHPVSLEWLHLQVTFAAVAGVQSGGEYLPFIPAHKINAEIGARHEKLLFFEKTFITLGSHIAFAQENTAPDETATDGYTLLDLAAGGSIRAGNQSLMISIGANNLLDTRYVDHLSTLKEVHYLNPGRNISLKIKVPFTT
jgi:iron complex outermembrane receptor protein